VSVPDLGILARKGSLYVTRPTTASYMATTAELRAAVAAVFDALRAGHFTVHIGQRFGLAETQEAHRALESRSTTGSTVIVP
jgi:NADPH2:quinone reductase